jgi:hypothetical protein
VSQVLPCTFRHQSRPTKKSNDKLKDATSRSSRNLAPKQEGVAPVTHPPIPTQGAYPPAGTSYRDLTTEPLTPCCSTFPLSVYPRLLCSIAKEVSCEGSCSIYL